MNQAKCRCNQFQTNGTCSHMKPHNGPRYQHGHPIPRAIERMHNRVMSKDEIKERKQDGN